MTNKEEQKLEQLSIKHFGTPDWQAALTVVSRSDIAVKNFIANAHQILNN